jgi:hypothetical protein
VPSWEPDASSTVNPSIESANKRGRDQRGRIFRAVVASVIFALCLLPAFTKGTLDEPLSPIDEAAHIDYAVHLAAGSPPSWDSRLTLSTRKIMVCAGISSVSTSCELKVQSPKRYSASGYSYETQQPPLGYVPYAIAWKVLNLSSDTPQRALRDLRLANLFWALCDVMLFGLVAYLLAFSIEVLIGGALFLGLNPQTISSLTYVTNDAPAIPVGLLCVLMYLWLFGDGSRLRFASKQTNYLLLGALGILIALFKTTFLAVPLAFLLLIVFRRRKIAQYVVLRNAAVIQILAGTAVAILYQLWNSSRSVTSSATVEHALLSFSSISHFPFSTIGQSISYTTNLFVAGSTWSLIFFLLGSAGLVVTNLARPIPESQMTSILDADTGSVLVTGILLAIGQTVFLYELGHFNFASPVRYLTPLLALLTVPVVGQLRLARKFTRYYVLLGFITCLILLK